MPIGACTCGTKCPCCAWKLQAQADGAQGSEDTVQSAPGRQLLAIDETPPDYRCRAPIARADAKYCAALFRTLARCRRLFGRFTLRCTDRGATACSTSLAQIQGGRCGAQRSCLHNHMHNHNHSHSRSAQACSSPSSHKVENRRVTVRTRPNNACCIPCAKLPMPHPTAMWVGACRERVYSGIAASKRMQLSRAFWPSQFRGLASRSWCSAAATPRCGAAGRATPSRGRARSPACGARRGRSRR